MFLFTYPAAILSIVCVVFAAVLFLRKWQEPLARLLAFYTLSIGLWIGSNAIADVAYTDLMLLFWSGVAMIAAPFSISLYLCFVHQFINKRGPGIARAAIYFLPTAVFSIGAFSKYSVEQTIILGDTPAQIVPGVFYNYLSYFIYAGLAFGSYQLARHYFTKATAQERLQILYMEAGFLLLFGGMLVFSVILPMLGELRFFTLGTEFSVFFMAASGYAILKHRLLDIKMAVQRSAIYSALIGCVILFYLGALQAASFILTSDLRWSSLAASILTTIAGVLGIPPLQKLFQKTTDRIFFKDRYDFSQAIDELSQVLNKNLDLDQLLARSADVLAKTLKTESAAIRLLPDGGTTDDAAMLQPISANGEVVAEVRLGKKLSGDPYFEHDERLLQAFSYQCGVAIERAKLYRRVMEHSEQLEAKVEERTKEIRALQETQAQMMLDISHSLQTPLTILKGRLGIARNRAGDAAEFAGFEQSIDKISEFISRLLKLANLAKAEAVEKADVDVSAMFEDIISYFAVLAEDQNIRIDTSIAPGVRIRGNKAQLEELVLNLLSNAAKYIDNDRRISLALAIDGGAAKFTIRDSGSGIPQEAMPRLFTRFYRGPGGARASGTGLGLSICKRIVDLHGGDIRIDSVVGRSTTVTVTLPEATVLAAQPSLA